MRLTSGVTVSIGAAVTNVARPITSSPDRMKVGPVAARASTTRHGGRFIYEFLFLIIDTCNSSRVLSIACTALLRRSSWFWPCPSSLH